jgi:hypothetical protein
MKKAYEIDRSKWRSGGDEFELSEFILNVNVVGRGETVLCNDEGFMCCLGQICVSEGVNVGGSPEPMVVGETIDILTIQDEESGIWENTELSKRAMDINDDCFITIEEREQKLIELFRKYNIELSFHGDAVFPNKVVEPTV